jgi:hypothetical protein
VATCEVRDIVDVVLLTLVEPTQNGQDAENDIYCGFVRSLFHLSYFTITIVVAVIVMSVGQFGSGASLLAGSFLAWFGGSVARGLLYGTSGQKIIGMIMGIIADYFALLLANWGQATVTLFNIGFSAPLWVLVGAAIGFVFAGRRDVGV